MNLDERRQQELFMWRAEMIRYWERKESDMRSDGFLDIYEVGLNYGVVDSFRMVAGGWQIYYGIGVVLVSGLLAPAYITAAAVGVVGGATLIWLGHSDFSDGARNLATRLVGLTSMPDDDGFFRKSIDAATGEAVERYVGFARSIRIFGIAGFLPDQHQLARLRMINANERAKARGELERLGAYGLSGDGYPQLVDADRRGERAPSPQRNYPSDRRESGGAKPVPPMRPTGGRGSQSTQQGAKERSTFTSPGTGAGGYGGEGQRSSRGAERLGGSPPCDSDGLCIRMVRDGPRQSGHSSDQSDVGDGANDAGPPGDE